MSGPDVERVGSGFVPSLALFYSYYEEIRQRYAPRVSRSTSVHLEIPTRLSGENGIF